MFFTYLTTLTNLVCCIERNDRMIMNWERRLRKFFVCNFSSLKRFPVWRLFDEMQRNMIVCVQCNICALISFVIGGFVFMWTLRHMGLQNWEACIREVCVGHSKLEFTWEVFDPWSANISWIRWWRHEDLFVTACWLVSRPLVVLLRLLGLGRKKEIETEEKYWN
jgi:hypothetical protein